MRFPSLVLAFAVTLAGAGLPGQPAAAQSPCAAGEAFTFRGGLRDEFAPPFDPTSRSAALNAAFPTAQWKDFDDLTLDRFVGHTFTDLPPGIVRAELEVRLLPLDAGPVDDARTLGRTRSGLVVESLHSASLPEAAGAWGLLQNGRTTFTIPLGAGDAPLLAQMSSQHSLDLLIKDDTAVDYAELRVWPCPPPVFASGLPHRALGGALVASDAHGGVTVSNVGSSGSDGVAVGLGHAVPLQVELGGLDAAPVGAFLDLRAERAGDPAAGRLLREADSWSLARILSSPSYHVRVYDGDRLVGVLPAPPGVNLHFSGVPQLVSPGPGGASGPGGEYICNGCGA